MVTKLILGFAENQQRLSTRMKYLFVWLILIVIVYVEYNSYSGATVRTPLPQPSRHRLSYHLPVGVTELKQCRRAFRLFHGKVTETPVYKEFHYEIKLITVDAEDAILLHVRETRNGLPTGGGSSLLALSDSWQRRLCFYDDFFNGVYAIWCPPPAPGTCTRLRVELKYAIFSAYTIGYFPVRDAAPCVGTRRRDNGPSPELDSD